MLSHDPSRVVISTTLEDPMFRGLGMTAVAAVWMVASASPAAAQFVVGPGVFGPGQGGGTERATTVKSSKSNTSDRAITVKSSKSNTSDRLGGGSQAGNTGGPLQATNLNSSRSNIYRTKSGSGGGTAARATTVKSSKSNTSD
jgi:hypothetical protein